VPCAIQSRLQLSAISSYSLGAPGEGGEDDGAGAGAAPSSRSSRRHTSAELRMLADEEAAEAVAMEEAAAQVEAEQHQQQDGTTTHSHATHTEIDPYSLGHSVPSYYSSGLLGPDPSTTMTEGEGEGGGEAGVDDADAAAEHDRPFYGSGDAGWMGSFREQDDEEDLARAAEAQGTEDGGEGEEVDEFQREWNDLRARDEQQHQRRAAGVMVNSSEEEDQMEAEAAERQRRRRKRIQEARRARRRKQEEGASEERVSGEATPYGEQGDEYYGYAGDEYDEQDNRSSTPSTSSRSGSGSGSRSGSRSRSRSRSPTSGSDRSYSGEEQHEESEYTDPALHTSTEMDESMPDDSTQAASSLYGGPASAAAASAATPYYAATTAVAHPYANVNFSPATPMTPHAAKAAAASRAAAAANYGLRAPMTPSHIHPHSHTMSYPTHSPSSSSPLYSYSPHHTGYSGYSPSPHLGPTSPRIGYGGGHTHLPYGATSASGGATSPRQDVFASVTHRLESMTRYGIVQRMMTTAAKYNQEVSTNNTTNASSTTTAAASPAPDYNQLSSTSAGTPSSSSSMSSSSRVGATTKSALLAIDHHLLRRYLLHVLDSDQIIRGIVENKSGSGGGGHADGSNNNISSMSGGIEIRIVEVLHPPQKARGADALSRQDTCAKKLWQALQSGGKDAERSTRSILQDAHNFFPPLSTLMGGIQISSNQTSNTTSSRSSPHHSTSVGGGGGSGGGGADSSTSTDSFAVERAFFSNFEVAGIMGECHLGEMQAPPPTPPSTVSSSTGAKASSPPNASDSYTAAAQAALSSGALDRFSLGDQVKALVISVDVHSEKVYLSMNQNRLRGNVATKHKLGLIPKEMNTIMHPPPTPTHGSDQPSYTTTATTPISSSTGSTFLHKLRPELQDRVHSYATTTGTTPSTPSLTSTQPTSNSMPPSAAPTPSYGNMYSSSTSYGGMTPTHPSTSSQPPNTASTTPLHMHQLPSAPSLYKAHSLISSSGGGGASAQSSSTPSLSLFGNPLLLAKARGFLVFLHEQPLFKNPEGMNKLLECYGINQHGSLNRKINLDPQCHYKSLRHLQNLQWAKESVVKGIQLAKLGSFSNAMKCYKHALDIEPNFTQAYVARGAAYVLQGQLEKACREFEMALKIDPDQQYAKTYLQAAREKLGHSTQPSNTLSKGGVSSSSSIQPTVTSLTTSTPAGRTNTTVDASQPSLVRVSSSHSKRGESRERHKSRDKDGDRTRKKDKEREKHHRERDHHRSSHTSRSRDKERKKDRKHAKKEKKTKDADPDERDRKRRKKEGDHDRDRSHSGHERSHRHHRHRSSRSHSHSRSSSSRHAPPPVIDLAQSTSSSSSSSSSDASSSSSSSSDSSPTKSAKHKKKHSRKRSLSGRRHDDPVPSSHARAHSISSERDDHIDLLDSERTPASASTSATPPPPAQDGDDADADAGSPFFPASPQGGNSASIEQSMERESDGEAFGYRSMMHDDADQHLETNGDDDNHGHAPQHQSREARSELRSGGSIHASHAPSAAIHHGGSPMLSEPSELHVSSDVEMQMPTLPALSDLPYEPSLSLSQPLASPMSSSPLPTNMQLESTQPSGAGVLSSPPMPTPSAADSDRPTPPINDMHDGAMEADSEAPNHVHVGNAEFNQSTKMNLPSPADVEERPAKKIKTEG